MIIDGWKGGVLSKFGGIKVAPYHETEGLHKIDPMAVTYGEYGGFRYISGQHLTGHILGSYAMSPFDGPVVALVWDGGTSPRFYAVDPANRRVKLLGTAFHYYGTLYSIMCYYFGPFAQEGFEPTEGVDQFGRYDWPGKVMSYYTRGKAIPAFQREVDEAFATGSKIWGAERGLRYAQDGRPEHWLCLKVRELARHHGATGEDCLYAIHDAIQSHLINTASDIVGTGNNLIFTGGSALNIKWNSAFRRAGINVWVPPVPNDCGSAIGQAVIGQIHYENKWKVGWDVYIGPSLVKEYPQEGWTASVCSPEAVGLLIARGTVIVALHGKAEIGPRALGHRSILSSPVKEGMRDHLNTIKRREGWRPVAPIVLEDHASDWFSPGTADPFMLFDHSAKDDTRTLAPAIVHEDGTARVQTVTEGQDPITAAIIRAHATQTGIPIICNTSANHNGSGFFPSIRAACDWAADNGVDHVWDGDNNQLYSKD